MTGRSPLTREEAAAALGLPSNAEPEEIRRAWRMWARISHPDAGGDPAEFARLEQARRALQTTPGPAASAPPPRPPRPTLADVVRVPARKRPVIAITGLAAISLAVLPALLHAPTSSIPFAVAAAPAAVGAAAWAAWMTREVVTAGADHEHRIVVLALLWLPLALMQQIAAGAVGSSLLPVLPLSALPLAAAASAINPGAGLWRPVRRPTPG